MAVTLLNVFKVPQEHEDMFLRNWNETSGVYARTGGLSTPGCTATSAWEARHSPSSILRRGLQNEAIIQAHKDYVFGEESIPGVEFHPAIYEEIIAIKNLLSHQSEGTE